MSELDIHLSAIQAGDSDAFACWVAGAEPSLRLSLSRYATVCDTEAVVQETLLRIWQLAPRITSDGRPNALLRFGVRVARNTAISEIRRLGTRAPEPAEAESVAPVEPDPLLREAIVFCREKLRGKPALALAARLAGEADDRDLAAEIGMSLNTFLKNVGRARQALIECLARQGIRLHGGMVAEGNE